MVTLESGEETIYAVDTQSGQMQNQETHVLLEDGDVYKRQPLFHSAGSGCRTEYRDRYVLGSADADGKGAWDSYAV